MSPGDASNILDNLWTQPIQGATSDSPAVQSLTRPQTKWTPFLPKYLNGNNIMSKNPFSASPFYSDQRSFSYENNGNNAPTQQPSFQEPSNDKTVMTSDEVERLFAKNLMDNGVTKDFSKPMEGKGKEKSSSALWATKSSNIPTVGKVMTSTELRNKAKGKLIPKDVTDYFNKNT